MTRYRTLWNRGVESEGLSAEQCATSLDMTMLYTQTEQERERGQVTRILEHLGRAKKRVENLDKMSAAGGVQ